MKKYIVNDEETSFVMYDCDFTEVRDPFPRISDLRKSEFWGVLKSIFSRFLVVKKLRKIPMTSESSDFPIRGITKLCNWPIIPEP